MLIKPINRIYYTRKKLIINPKVKAMAFRIMRCKFSILTVQITKLNINPKVKVPACQVRRCKLSVSVLTREI